MHSLSLSMLAFASLIKFRKDISVGVCLRPKQYFGRCVDIETDGCFATDGRIFERFFPFIKAQKNLFFAFLTIAKKCGRLISLKIRLNCD